jgi:hypothetical protein
MDSGESLRAPRSPATLTGGRSANESLESLGALLSYRGVGEPCRSNLCHSGPWSLAPALLFISGARTSGSELVSKLDNQEDRREAPVPL